MAVVGAHIVDPANVNFLRTVLDHTADIGKLGICSAIGSGAPELLAYARRFERQLEPMDGFNVVANFVSLANIQLLQREIYQDNYTKHWGGYLESIVYNNVAGKWSRQCKTLILNFQVHVDDNGADWGLIDKIICYDPGVRDGHILCLHDGANLRAIEYTIRGFIGEPEERPNSWNNWKPDMIGVAVTASWKDDRQRGRAHVLAHAYRTDYNDGTQVSLIGNQFNFRLKERYCEDLIERAIAGLRGDALG